MESNGYVILISIIWGIVLVFLIKFSQSTSESTMITPDESTKPILTNNGWGLFRKEYDGHHGSGAPMI